MNLSCGPEIREMELGNESNQGMDKQLGCAFVAGDFFFNNNYGKQDSVRPTSELKSQRRSGWRPLPDKLRTLPWRRRPW